MNTKTRRYARLLAIPAALAIAAGATVVGLDAARAIPGDPTVVATAAPTDVPGTVFAAVAPSNAPGTVTFSAMTDPITADSVIVVTANNKVTGKAIQSFRFSIGNCPVADFGNGSKAANNNPNVKSEGSLKPADSKSLASYSVSFTLADLNAGGCSLDLSGATELHIQGTVNMVGGANMNKIDVPLALSA